MTSFDRDVGAAHVPCTALRMHALAAAQAAIYTTTGVWPVAHIRSFEAVTGPKRERWLVKTMGLFIAAVGTALGVAARKPVSREIAVLGAASAAALFSCDVVYVAKRRISPVYLLDAVVEGAFAAGWIAVILRQSRRDDVP